MQAGDHCRASFPDQFEIELTGSSLPSDTRSNQSLLARSRETRTHGPNVPPVASNRQPIDKSREIMSPVPTSAIRSVVLALVGLTTLALTGAPSLAQREYHNSDGPYQGLRCDPDETVVPILGGVKCQKLPQCGRDQTMMPGPNGLECKQVEKTPSVPAAQADDPTGVIPEIKATVVALRFFESPPQPTDRDYDDLFFYNAARYIYWELDLEHPAPGRPTSFTLEEVWYGPGGDVVHRASRVFTVAADWASSTFYAGARLVGTKSVATQNPLYYDCLNRQQRTGMFSAPCSATTDVDIEDWPIGTYQVDILVNQRRVATGWFAMRAKNEIYGEVAAKTRDRSSPANVIAPLGAKVTALKFFEAGDTAPPQGQRSYATQFAKASVRNIVWELDLAHSAPGRWLPLPIEALLYFKDAAGDHVVQRKVLQSAVPADWSDTYDMDYFGWKNDYYYYRAGTTTPSPRTWLPGSYRVDLYVLDTKVASGSFEIR